MADTPRVRPPMVTDAPGVSGALKVTVTVVSVGP